MCQVLVKVIITEKTQQIFSLNKLKTTLTKLRLIVTKNNKNYLSPFSELIPFASNQKSP